MINIAQLERIILYKNVFRLDKNKKELMGTLILCSYFKIAQNKKY